MPWLAPVTTIRRSSSRKEASGSSSVTIGIARHLPRRVQRDLAAPAPRSSRCASRWRLYLDVRRELLPRPCTTSSGIETEHLARLRHGNHWIGIEIRTQGCFDDAVMAVIERLARRSRHGLDLLDDALLRHRQRA